MKKSYALHYAIEIIIRNRLAKKFALNPEEILRLCRRTREV
jgi:hypothetical protein